MAKVPKDWERRLIELAAIHGVTDFLLRGRLTAAESKVFYTILNKIGRPAARTTAVTAGRLGVTALGVGKQIALRHPVLTAGAVVYYTYKNRDEIGALVEQGYEVVQDIRASGALDIGAMQELRREQLADVPSIPFTDFKIRPSPSKGLPTAIFGKKRKPSAFNRAVSAGMKAVKSSPRYGGKGKIRPAKKVFAMVTKLAASKKKKKKAPKSGIRRRIWNAMKGLR